MDNRAHKVQKRKHKSYDRQKRSDEKIKHYEREWNKITREARISKEKYGR